MRRSSHDSRNDVESPSRISTITIGQPWTTEGPSLITRTQWHSSTPTIEVVEMYRRQPIYSHSPLRLCQDKSTVVKLSFAGGVLFSFLLWAIIMVGRKWILRERQRRGK